MRRIKEGNFTVYTFQVSDKEFANLLDKANIEWNGGHGTFQFNTLEDAKKAYEISKQFDPKGQLFQKEYLR